MLEVSVVVAFFIVFLVVSTIRYYWNRPRNLPPGPIGIPFLGCIPYMKANETINVLEGWQKRYGPIFSFYMANKPIVVLGNLEVIKEALVKQGDIFSERPQLGIRNIGAGRGEKQRPANLGLVMCNGELWKEQRRFALGTLRDFGFGRPILQGKIHEEMSYFLDEFQLQNGKPFDPALTINNAVSNVICNLTFGKRFDYSDVEFHEMLKKINYRVAGSNFSFISPFIYVGWLFQLPFFKQTLAKFRREGNAILKFVESLIVEHEKTYSEVEEPSDYIHAFIKARNNNGGQFFFDDQLLSSVTSLFVAGTETTSTTLRWALLYMAEHPDVQQKVFEEISNSVGVETLPNMEEKTRLPYTEAVIMEIQRIANISPMSVVHSTTADAVVSGYHIPKGCVVVPFLYAVHSDPQNFPDPKKFKPDRFLDEVGKPKKPEAFVPFSIGKRVCLGESLAKMELYLFFTGLMQKFQFRFPDNTDKPDLSKVILGLGRSPLPFKICAVQRHT